MADGYVRYRFGDFLIDMAQRELLHNEQPVFVQSRVFDLLTYLARHGDRVVDKIELREAVWPGMVITDAAMSRAIMKARSAVGDDANDSAIIKTIHGKGFRFVAPVELIPAPGLQPMDTSIGKSTTPARRFGVIALVLITAALMIFVAGHLWPVPWLVQQPGGNAITATGKPGGFDPATANPTYPPNSIAVLPFVNMSDDAANEYFADGISEELLNLLTKISELKVTSRTSAFSLKGRDFKVADIARELNVAHVLEGSVRKAGNRVRITAQLIDTRTDAHVWSETYDRTLDDIFAIQDEIAVAVVDALKITLFVDAPRAKTVDPEAYALFLQARYLNAQGTSETFVKSIELYEHVLAIAPNYARAWRGMAVNYVNQANKGLRPKGESFTLAREAVNRALILDPAYARAHALLGVFSMTVDRDLEAAAPHFQRALSLEPNDLVLLSYASSFLLRLGRLDEVIAFREYDVAHDPLDPIGHNNLAWAYVMARRSDEAIATIATLLMLAPRYNGAHITWGKALLLKGEFESALEVVQKERSEVWRLIGLVIAYYALGQQTESDKVLTRLIGEYDQDWAYYIALVLAYRGESDLAFNWLNKAVENSDTSLTYLAIEPLFDNLREDDRWVPFLESIGLSTSQLRAIKFEAALPETNQ
ncbi:MAG: hypothetical protein GY732_04145 [Gammaproteobacteria bacterium]|nr:hypothetical protein [Gammaproteobacteria bacterium]